MKNGLVKVLERHFLAVCVNDRFDLFARGNLAIDPSIADLVLNDLEDGGRKPDRRQGQTSSPGFAIERSVRLMS